ncbi:MAG: hypothetical protein RMI43_06940 [Candidatus Caldarchaeum sp.]|nr:hypothetical protein [Candidatus Caldarchaeum sp.]MCX8201397.1 hypothetical protein [Candidatus Caldarchaeum sp.]MDW8063889.1 hypothetical protein [Candidatus Caldarchaeum sp.]MDW8435422.1 hypothetical protein [Candidatus Caldarchaeum sp.]
MEKIGFGCRDCVHFLPFHLMTEIGTCSNDSSPCHGRLRYGSDPACSFFGLASVRTSGLPGIEFYWCATCREGLHREELVNHVGHRVHVGASTTDAEFNVESTCAGD